MKCAILISLYNAEKTLDKTFESIQEQTCQDFRIVAINDCSKDTTLELLKKWQDIFGKKRFLLINNEHNIGLTRSLNKGLQNITEPYTARIDADDWWHKEKLAKQIKQLEEYPEYGIIGTWYENISSKGSKKIRLPITNEAIRKNIFKRNPFAHSTVIFRTPLILKVGSYNNHTRYGQDYELWLRLLEKTSFANIPEFLCFRTVENTMTAKKQREQMFQCVKTQLKYLRLYKRPWIEYRFIIEPLLVALSPEWLRNLKRELL